MSRLVPLPVHPDARVAYYSSLSTEVGENGLGAVRKDRLSRFTDPSNATDPLQRRINQNLLTAFEERDLRSIVDAELLPVFRVIARQSSANRDAPADPDSPHMPHDDAPGYEELFDNPHVYHDFLDWLAIFWGIDRVDAMFLDDERYQIGLTYYNAWLEEHLEVMSQLQEFQDFFEEHATTLLEILSMIDEAFDSADDFLKTLLESLQEWFFRQFGASP